MLLRRFNERGLEAFEAYLQRLREDPGLEPPPELLDGAEHSEPLEPAIEAQPEPFENRMAFARWLHEATERSGASVPRADAGFWSWLSLALFDQVCPKDGKGRRKPGATARHIPDTQDWRRRYRHLLANPYDIYFLHQEDPARALVALAKPLDKPGELTEQIASRLDLVTCPGSMALATKLCIDPKTSKPRRGASGNLARRFGKLMNQYACTWDLPEVEPDAFVRLMPKEFQSNR